MNRGFNFLGLDCGTMSRNRIVQTYRKGRSCLHFKKRPKHFRKETYPNFTYTLKARQTDASAGPKLKILVDTGVEFCRISKKYKRTSASGEVTYPKEVQIHMGGEDYIRLSPLLPHKAKDFDILLGRRAFQRYKCALDYSSGKLYFHVKSQCYKVRMGVLCSEAV